MQQSPRLLSSDPIFMVNHLGFVVSSASNLENYLIHALEITGEFIRQFSVDEQLASLRSTLQARPPQHPVESFLKSQRLWIMHKLLVCIPGVREKLNYFLTLPSVSGPGPSVDQTRMRRQAIAMLSNYRDMLAFTVTPVGQVIRQVQADLHAFAHHQKGVMEQENARSVHRRCEIIRWFSGLVCDHGRQWMENIPITALIEMKK